MKNDGNSNPLNPKKLWYPKYSLENAIFEDSYRYASEKSYLIKIIAEKKDNGTPFTYNGYEGILYLMNKTLCIEMYILTIYVGLWLVQIEDHLSVKRQNYKEYIKIKSLCPSSIDNSIVVLWLIWFF